MLEQKIFLTPLYTRVWGALCQELRVETNKYIFHHFNNQTHPILNNQKGFWLCFIILVLPLKRRSYELSKEEGSVKRTFTFSASSTGRGEKGCLQIHPPPFTQMVRRGRKEQKLKLLTLKHHCNASCTHEFVEQYLMTRLVEGIYL